jgi:RNA polymerase sigma-54 factor
LKAGLQLKLAQHLTLTPQLQQSIRLLQLSTLELQQEITAALIENPLLEMEEGDNDFEVSIEAIDVTPTLQTVLDGCDGPGGDGDMDFVAASGEGDIYGRDDLFDSPAQATLTDAASPSDAPAAEAILESGSEDFAAEPNDLSEWGSGGSGDGDDDSGEWQRARSVTLQEHLRDQLALLREPERVMHLMVFLIDGVDENGMLQIELEDVVEALSIEAAEIEKDWDRALALLHAFDPPGVGARSVQECLLLQLRQRRHNADVAIAKRIVADAFDALARRDVVRLRKLYSLTEPELRAVLEIIQSLSPRPGAAFADVSASALVPDIIVRRTKSRWVADLNGVVVPKLRVNSVYADMLQREKEGRATPLSTQLQEARWLVKNVAQRFETILRVANEIVERQQAFFDHGPVAMRPLVLREVADALGLHESTISRVTTQKYLTSIRGTFEFKYFFGSHVATDAGGAASSTAIRSMIKTLIQQESTNNPLTDSRIAELLGEQGIIVARRTVAKYREQQNIDPVNLRRRDE